MLERLYFATYSELTNVRTRTMGSTTLGL